MFIYQTVETEVETETTGYECPFMTHVVFRRDSRVSDMFAGGHSSEPFHTLIPTQVHVYTHTDPRFSPRTENTRYGSTFLESQYT